MKFKWTLSSLHRNHALLLKLLIFTFLLCLAFRVFYSSSRQISTEPPFSKQSSEEQIRSKVTPPINSPAPRDDSTQIDTYPRLPSEGKCDLFTGDWIPKSSGPAYTNETCNLIEGHQNCMTNGRPDTAYLYWKWKPRKCQLPEFDPKKFLEMMRNKSWALIGDSISRNHVQSLLCLLSTVEQAVELYHDANYQSRRWHFPSYNLNVSVIRSPFLVQAAIFEDFNGVSKSEIELHFDKLDKTWADAFSSFDYIIFSTGKWFLKTAVYYENNTLLGCHYCPRRNLTELGFDFSYRKSLRYVLDFIVTSGHKGLIFFRTSTPEHFENGEWYEGGNCNRTAPFKDGEVKAKDLHLILRRIELEEFERVKVKASESGVNLRLLDVAPLSILRPDGHPDAYRFPHTSGGEVPKMPSDCLHWCLPGPIDAWNDVIMEMVGKYR